MRNVKKLVCMLVAIIMVLSCVAGCAKTTGDDKTSGTTAGTKGNDSGTSASGDAGTSDGPIQELPISTDGLTLKVAIPVGSTIEDIETNKLTLYIEEQTGIKLDIIQLSTSDTATQINSIMNGGDLPDIFMGCWFSYENLCTYADAGLIQPIDEYLDQWGYNLKNTILADPYLSNALAYVTYDDHVWAMPSGGGMVTNLYGHWPARIQTAFLEELNMELPTTLDELRAFLEAVKEKHPDVIPMASFADANNILSNISQAYQFTDRNNYLKVNDGKVSFIGNNDLFKEAVEYTKGMVDDGLIDPASWTQDQTVFSTLLAQDGNNIAVAACGYSVANAFDSSSDEYMSLNLLGTLEGPHGYCATQTDFAAANVRVSMVVTSACEHVEEAVRLFDFCLSDDFAVKARVGFEGEQWKKAADGAIGRDGEQAWFTLLDTQEWIKPSTNVIWGNENFIHCNVMNHCEAVDNGEKYPPAKAIIAQDLKSKVTNEELPALVMDAETAAEYNELKDLIVKYVSTNAAQFILGNRDLSEWDAYCAELEAMGVARYVEMTQEAYDAMFG